MDTRELKVSIPERGGADDRADSPEQSGLSTPKEYSEYQSGSKRLRTKDGWEEGEPGAGPGATDDAPGASARLHVAKPEEIRQLQERTKSACAQLADVIVALRRERCAATTPRPPRVDLNRVFEPLAARAAFEDLTAPGAFPGASARAIPNPDHRPPPRRARREWTEAKEANTQRERELRLLLRSIERCDPRDPPETQI